MKRIGIAAVAGGIVLFIWSFISWTFIPWHMFGKMPGEAAIVQAMRGAQVPSGAYMIPGIAHGKLMTVEEQKTAEEQWDKDHREGPLAFIMYESEGGPPMAIMQFVIGIVLDVVLAGIAAFLLAMAAPAVPSFGGRVFFVVLLGIYTAVGTNLMDWNWMNQPLRFSIEMAGDSIVASLLLGITLAVIVKPQSELMHESEFEVSAGP